MKKLFYSFLCAFAFFFLIPINNYASSNFLLAVVNSDFRYEFYASDSQYSFDDFIFYSDTYDYCSLYYWNGSSYVSALPSSINRIKITPNGNYIDYYYGLSCPRSNLTTTVPILDYVPTNKYEPIITDNGLGYDISLSHTEINYLLSGNYWEFISVKNAWNYPTVTELSFDIFINGEKRDTINKLNNFSTNFGVAFDFFTSHYNVVKGDTIRILCTPIGDSIKGLQRGVEWVVGSKEDVPISKIPNVTPKIDINNVPYTPSIQKERQFVYNPITNDYVTNNYYTQNYESPDLSNIENQLDYIIQYIIDNPMSSGVSTPQTIINYNTTNKNYNFNFGDFDIGDIDVDLEIGNAKEHIKHSFDDFITNIQLLIDSPFEKIVIAFGVGIGLIILVLAIVIVAKILDIIIP